MKIIRNPFRETQRGTRVWIRKHREWVQTEFFSTAGSTKIKVWDPLCVRAPDKFLIISIDDASFEKPKKKVVIKHDRS